MWSENQNDTQITHCWIMHVMAMAKVALKLMGINSTGRNKSYTSLCIMVDF